MTPVGPKSSNLARSDSANLNQHEKRKTRHIFRCFTTSYFWVLQSAIWSQASAVRFTVVLHFPAFYSFFAELNLTKLFQTSFGQNHRKPLGGRLLKLVLGTTAYDYSAYNAEILNNTLYAKASSKNFRKPPISATTEWYRTSKVFCINENAFSTQTDIQHRRTIVAEQSLAKREPYLGHRTFPNAEIDD